MTDDDDDDHTGVHAVEANSRTAIGHTEEERAPAAEQAFHLAYDRLRQIAAVARGPAVAVAAVSSRGRIDDALLVPAGEALVIGRHTQCGLRLPEKKIALRHLVLHVSAQDGDAPTLRLWDLNTHRPFLTEEGERATAVVAEGFLYAAVGPHALLIAPSSALSSTRADEAWRALPPRGFLDRRDSTGPRMAEVTAPSASTITRVRPASALGEGAGPPWAELRVRYGKEGHEKTVPVSLEHLHRGVLLGRYDRCGVQFTVDENISRVHLLLARIGADVWAIDTASTNGTRRNSRELTAAIISDDEWLELGETGVCIRLRRLQHAVA